MILQLYSVWSVSSNVCRSRRSDEALRCRFVHVYSSCRPDGLRLQVLGKILAVLST